MWFSLNCLGPQVAHTLVKLIYRPKQAKTFKPVLRKSYRLRVVFAAFWALRVGKSDAGPHADTCTAPFKPPC